MIICRKDIYKVINTMKGQKEIYEAKIMQKVPKRREKDQIGFQGQKQDESQKIDENKIKTKFR